MAEIDDKKFYDKLNEIEAKFTSSLNDVAIKVAEVVVKLESLKIHDAPCRFLENHEQKLDSEITNIKTKQSHDVSKLHDKIDGHIDNHHSINSENTPDKILARHVGNYHSPNAPNSAERLMSDHIQKEHSSEASDRRKTMLYTALAAIATVASFVAGFMLK